MDSSEALAHKLNLVHNLSNAAGAILGGIASFDEDLAWLVHGNTLQILSLTTFDVTALLTFKARVLCCASLIINKKAYLAVGLSDATLALVDVSASAISRTISLGTQPTNIVEIQGCRDLHPSVAPLLTPVAIGTWGGQVFVVDVSFDPASEVRFAELTPSVPSENMNPLRDGLHRHVVLNRDSLRTSRTGVMHFEFMQQQRMATKVLITALSVIPQLNAIAVGYSFGGVQIWSLSTLTATATNQVRDAPITHFCYQTLPNTGNHYLWIGENTSIFQPIPSASVKQTAPATNTNSSWLSPFSSSNAVGVSMNTDNVSSVLPSNTSKRAQVTLYAYRRTGLEYIFHRQLGEQQHYDYPTSIIGIYAPRGAQQITDMDVMSDDIAGGKETNNARALIVWDIIQNGPSPQRALSVEIFDLNRWLLNEEREAHTEFITMPINISLANRPLDVRFDQTSYSVLPSEDTNDIVHALSFNARVLTQTTLHSVESTAPALTLLNEVTSRGVYAFGQEIEQIHKQCARLDLIDVSQSQEMFNNLLSFAWENDLIAAISHLILAVSPPSTAVDAAVTIASEDPNTLSHVFQQPRRVYVWVEHQVSQLLAAANHDVINQLLDESGKRALDSSTKENYQQALNDKIHQLHTLSLIVDALCVRASQKDQSKDILDLKRLKNRIIKSSEKLKVICWFVEVGFLPVAAGRYHAEGLEAEWKIRRETRNEIRTPQIQSVSSEMLPESKEPTPIPFFIDELQKQRGIANAEYPPSSLTAIISSFDSMTENASSEDFNTQLEYVRYVLLYFLIDGVNQLSTDNFGASALMCDGDRGALLSEFARQFNITKGWQQLIYSLWLLDAHYLKDFAMKAVAYFTSVDTLPHFLTSSKDSVIKLLIHCGSYKEALHFVNVCGCSSTQLRVNVLLANNKLQDTVTIQRQAASDSAQRRILIYLILAHCTTVVSIDELFTLPLDAFETAMIVKFFEKLIEEHEEAVDLLLAFYMTRSRLVDAMQLLIKHRNDQTDIQNELVRSQFLENLKQILPEIQQKIAIRSTTLNTNNASRQHRLIKQSLQEQQAAFVAPPSASKRKSAGRLHYRESLSPSRTQPLSEYLSMSSPIGTQDDDMDA